HVERLVAARYIGGAALQLARRKIAHGRVRVVDHDLGGAASERTLDRRVDLGEQQLPAGRRLSALADALLPVDDARGPFHITGQEDLHSCALIAVSSYLGSFLYAVGVVGGAHHAVGRPWPG